MDTSFDPAPYRCYVAPYGTLGIVCDCLSMYMLFMVFVSCRSPVVFRRLKHTTWAMWFFGIKAFGQLVLHWHVAIQGNCASQPHSLPSFDYAVIDFPHLLLGPVLILGAVLARCYNSRSTLPKSTASTKHSRFRCSQPPKQSWQSPETPSPSTASPIVEPPPAYCPRAHEDSGSATQGDFEMQNMTRRDLQAVADAALENHSVQGFAESRRVEEGEGGPGLGTNDDSTPPSHEGGKKISSNSRKRCGPMRMHIRPPLLIVMLASTVLLALGIRSLVDGLPTGFFGRGDGTSPGDWQYEMELHLGGSITGLCAALILSGVTHWRSVGPALRAGERARIRDYCVELFKGGLVARVFWTTIIVAMAILCLWDFLITDVLIGYAAFDKHGLRQFEGDQDTIRYWWYVALSLLPLLSS